MFITFFEKAAAPFPPLELHSRGPLSMASPVPKSPKAPALKSALSQPILKQGAAEKKKPSTAKRVALGALGVGAAAAGGYGLRRHLVRQAKERMKDIRKTVGEKHRHKLMERQVELQRQWMTGRQSSPLRSAIFAHTNKHERFNLRHPSPELAAKLDKIKNPADKKRAAQLHLWEKLENRFPEYKGKKGTWRF